MNKIYQFLTTQVITFSISSSVPALYMEHGSLSNLLHLHSMLQKSFEKKLMWRVGGANTPVKLIVLERAQPNAMKSEMG